MYYNYNDCLACQRVFNILDGGRGVGKTYGVLKVVIKDFIKTGNQFIWVRRYKDEVRMVNKGFFNKIQSEFPEHTFKTNGRTLLIDGQVCGYILALSQSSTNKGFSLLNNARTLIFDEYIIDNTGGIQRYLGNEMNFIYDIYETIFRTRPDARCFFLSNNISKINPLYCKFGLDKIKTNKYIDEYIYYEHIETSEELKQMKSNSPLLNMLKVYDKEYYDFNVNNKTLNDSETFIAKRPSSSMEVFSIVFKDVTVHIYYGVNINDKFSMAYYCCTKGDDERLNRYTFDIELVAHKARYIDKEVGVDHINMISNALKRNAVYFENQNVKRLMLENLRKYL